MRAILPLFSILFTFTAQASPWQEVTVLPWGTEPAQIGLSPDVEDELRYGPHGLAVSPDGEVAIIDRIHGKAVVVAADGRFQREIVVPGKPGPAALLPDGKLAVADELEDRLVRVLGVGGGHYRTPHWTMPPLRLMTWTDPTGATVVEGLNGLQLRLPLSKRTVEPYELTHGVPSPDGSASVSAFRRGDVLFVEFGDGPVKFADGVWPGGGDEGFTPGTVTVLATDGSTAVLALESVYTGSGPITTRRHVAKVDTAGHWGRPVELYPPGIIAIPDALAASPDGTVHMLFAAPTGCRLLRTWVEPPETGP